MRGIFLLVILVFLSGPHIVVSADTVDPSLLLCDDGKSDFKNIVISLENISINPLTYSNGKKQGLFFDVFLRNSSSYQKCDINFPFTVGVKDEFGNIYHDLSQTKSTSENLNISSLYPGEGTRVFCRFQTPVAAAKTLFVKLSDKSGKFVYQLTLETGEIDNWESVAGSREFFSEDLIIVYPREKRIFSPGERIFLKVGFSNRVSRPKNIHVILPNYVLTDGQARGQYELQVPFDRPEGDMQVVVMAEWGDPPDSKILSKTLFLHIKG